MLSSKCAETQKRAYELQRALSYQERELSAMAAVNELPPASALDRKYKLEAASATADQA